MKLEKQEAKEHPILFQTEMVQAILEGRKSQTRRIVKLKHLPISEIGSIYPDGSGLGWIAWSPKPVSAEETAKCYPGNEGFKCPYGAVGDTLLVRETFYPWDTGGYAYKADGFEQRYGAWERDTPKKFHDVERIEKWKPSIFMPKEACRIFLEITDIRVERLQDISEENAIAEGVENIDACHPYTYKGYLPAKQTLCWNAVSSYKTLWQSINGEASWNSNPFVWVISFKRIQK